MNTPFVFRAKVERAWQRELRLAVAVTDSVNGEPLFAGIDVEVRGLRRKPTVNAGGIFVWLAEQNAAPTEIVVDPGILPYLPHREPAPAPPVPPARHNEVRIALIPSPAYVFDAGTTGIRARLIEPGNADPQVPIADVDAWLEWQDEDLPPSVWTPALPRSRTNARGDFVALVRIPPDKVPRTDAQGRLRVRFAAQRGAVIKVYTVRFIKPGHIAGEPASLRWAAQGLV